jgi:hypothetical protein
MRRNRPFGVLLASASLCLELGCDMIFDSSATTQCPGCGSTGFHPLANWLNRDGLGQEPSRHGAPRLVVPRAA